MRTWSFASLINTVINESLLQIGACPSGISDPFVVTVFEMGIPLPHFCGNGGCAEHGFLIMSVGLAHGIVLSIELSHLAHESSNTNSTRSERNIRIHYLREEPSCSVYMF
jgi:hypothetical protein